MANEIVTLEKQSALLVSKTNDWITSELAKGTMRVPEGYDINNELRLAVSMISQVSGKGGRSIVEAQPQTVMNTLMLMVANGLSMAKNQCYAVMYGDKLQLLRSYFGTVSQLKRMFPNYKITANVVYAGDEFDYVYDDEIDCYRVNIKKVDFVNRVDKKENIVCAFGSIKHITTGKTVYTEVMSMSQILKNWEKGKTHNVQNDYPTEMAKRTLINRMCKMFINSSNSNVSTDEADRYNRMTEAEYEDTSEEPKKAMTANEVAMSKKSKGIEGLSVLIKKDKADDIPVVEPTLKDDGIKVNSESEIVEDNVVSETQNTTEEIDMEVIPF